MLKKENYARPDVRLFLKEEDLEETFVRSSGPGGQNVNKVSTCVVLKHRPSGVTVKCQEGRSQAANRAAARRILLEKLQGMEMRRRLERARQLSRVRQQKRKRSEKARDRMLKAKKRTGDKKKLRKKISSQGDSE